MLNVGLTGNIASGKSTVAQLLVSLGAVVIDADILAREAVEPGSPALQAISNRFGSTVLDHEGKLERRALRQIVFRDTAAREALNAIVHPVVAELRQRELDNACERGEKLVISDIPLLFETGLDRGFDAIVLVDASESVRLARLIENRALPEADALAMISAGWPAKQKRARSTFVIDNNGSVAELESHVLRLWNQLQSMAATSESSVDP